MKNGKQARYGRVSSVFLNSDNAAVFVNVVTGPNQEPREMRFSSPKPGVWYVPKEGDVVEVHDINGTNVARFPANSPKTFTFPENLTEGDLCFQLNKKTKLHFSVQQDDTVDVKLECDGKLTIDATDGFDVLDSEGYGIVSKNASGVFNWYHENIDFKTGAYTKND